MILLIGNEKIVKFINENKLTASESLVLLRIASLEQYFESAETFATTFNMNTSRVRAIRSKLVKIGAIKEISRGAHGKVYKLADFLCDTCDTIEDSKEENDMVEFKPSKSETNKKPIKSFFKQYKDYLSSWDYGEQYIEENFIQRKDTKRCQQEFANVVKYCDKVCRAKNKNLNLSDNDIIKAVNGSIVDYINYLKTDEYKNNQFSPRIIYSYDLWGKFAQVRNVKETNINKAKQYDPNKDLTTYGGEY